MLSSVAVFSERVSHLPTIRALPTRHDFPTLQEALLAIRKNPAIMLPYLNCAENVRGSYKVIVDFCGKEDAEEILRKNPGVLGCIPSRQKSHEKKLTKEAQKEGAPRKKARILLFPTCLTT